MKIRKLSIKNYKIFDEVEFDFTDLEGKTLDTVVLAGVNGCGKTTVLELMGLPFSGYGNDISRSANFEFDLSNITEREQKFRDMRSAKRVFNVRSIGDVPVSSDLLGNFKLCYFPILPSSTVDGNKDNYLELHINTKKSEVKAVALKEIRDFILKNRDIPPQKSIEKYIKKINSSVEGMGLQTRLVDMESEELVFETPNGKQIYFEQLSHGEQSLYFRAIYLIQLNLHDSIIMVDEPEAAFHPSWQQQIVHLLHNIGENNQVFLATHSPHIMASVPPESLFVLHVEEETRKIKVINMAKAGKHSQGVEPNRILREIMQVESLRGYETQRDIDFLTSLLTPEQFESAEAQQLIEKLTEQLGRQDSFIIRLEHQLLMLNRKKQTLVTAQ